MGAGGASFTAVVEALRSGVGETNPLAPGAALTRRVCVGVVAGAICCAGNGGAPNVPPEVGVEAARGVVPGTFRGGSQPIAWALLV